MGVDVVDEDRWARWAALAGVVFVVLVLLSTFIPGSPPKLSDSSLKIFRYFHDHKSSLQIASFLGGLAVIPALIWASALWRRLRSAEDDGRGALLAITGLVVGGTLATASGVIVVTVAVRLAGLTPLGARFFFTLATFTGNASAFGLALLALGTAMVTLRSGVFPRWFGWVSAALGLLWIVAGLGAAYTGDTPQTIALVVFLVFVVWILVSVALLWTPPKAAASSSAPAPTAS